MTVRPLADRILVKREEPSETVRGGIIIPDTAKEKPQEGIVIAVGPGRIDDQGKRVALEVKKGDRILMGKYAGTEVKIDGVEHITRGYDSLSERLASCGAHISHTVDAPEAASFDS